MDGQRAGLINKEFDIMCMDKLVNKPEELLKYYIRDLTEIAGSQGVELNMWLAMRGALTGQVTELHRNYHIPISNTGAGTMLLSNI